MFLLGVTAARRRCPSPPAQTDIQQRCAVATAGQRSTRFTVLLHLPPMDGHGLAPQVKNGPPLAGHGALAVRDALAAQIGGLPEQLRRSLTWDQGAEMSQHVQLRLDSGLAIYFCDPHSPWQRGTNENTVSLGLGSGGPVRQGGCRQHEVTLENTGRLRACLAFDLFLVAADTAPAHPSWLTRSLSVSGRDPSQCCRDR